MSAAGGGDGADFAVNCPVPASEYPVVTLGHGGGGRLMHGLIDRIFKAHFSDPSLEEGHDGAEVATEGRRIALTTDGFVVRPLFFPGGSIGELAVYGTANDLAMCGARPRYLTASFILEEGLPLADLDRVAGAMAEALRKAGMRMVTGDTKVVERGHGDGVFISTSGVGEVGHKLSILPKSVVPGDAILLSGDVGRHGVAVMSAREGLKFGNPPASDCAPLWPAVEALLGAGVEIHCLRDLTRGGLATSLVEIAQTARVRMRIDEPSVPASEAVRGACEILGLDPLYVANEGRFVAFVPARDADRALAAMRAVPVSSGACAIGSVESSGDPLVAARSAAGASRVIAMLSGEQLPRIC